MNPPAGFKEALVGVGFTAALFLSGFFIILTPLPLLYTLLKGGGRRFLHVAGFAFLFLLILYIFWVPGLHSFYARHPQWSWLLSVPGLPFTGYIRQEMITFFGLVTYLFYMGAAILSGAVLTSKRGPFRLFFGGSLIVFILTAAAFCALGFIEKQGLGLFAQDQFNAVISELSALKPEGIKASENLLYLKNNLERVSFYLLRLSPSLFFSYVLLVVILNTGLGGRLFARQLTGQPGSPASPETTPSVIRLNLWSTPFFGVWLVIAALGGYLGHVYFFRREMAALASGNVLIVMVLLYYLQGLAVLSHFFERKNIAVAIRRWIFILLHLFILTVGPLVVALGFFDCWFNFRKLPVKSPPL